MTGSNSGKLTQFKDIEDLINKQNQGFDTFGNSKLSNVDLNRLNLKNQHFKSVIFDNCFAVGDSLSFEECWIDGCEFRDGTYSDIQFNSQSKTPIKLEVNDVKISHFSCSGTRINNLSIEGCELDKLTVTSSEVEKISVKRTVVSHSVNFHSSECHDVSISGVEALWRLDQGSFTDLDLNRCVFVLNSRLNSVSIHGGNFQNCKFSKNQFTKVSFGTARLAANDAKPSRFEFCEFKSTAFDECLFGLIITDKTFESCSFNKISFNQPDMTGVNLVDIDFKAAHLYNSHFKHCLMGGCDFSTADIKDAHFESCDLKKADFSGAIMNTKTRFLECEVEDMRIDNYSLASMEESTSGGGFTKGNLMDMDVKDDLAMLRTTYSGVLMWVHLIALFAWLAPYVTYGIYLGWISKPTEEITDGKFEYVYHRIWDFIRTGNEIGGDTNWAALLIFVVLALYNINRFLLLYKTKTLEMKGTASGIPIKFSLTQRPVRWLSIRYQEMWMFAFYGLWGNVALVIVNTLLFMMRGIPIE